MESERPPQEACGVFAVHLRPDSSYGPIAHQMAAVGIGQLAHRGDEGTGMALWHDDGDMVVIHGEGDATVALSDNVIQGQDSWTAMTHGRYATSNLCSDSNKATIQPMITQNRLGTMAQGHNGDIKNANQLAEALGYESDNLASDSQLILHMVSDAIETGLDPIDAISHVSHLLVGAYSMTTMVDDRLLAWRDPWGFRPLFLGELGDGEGWVVASEQPAFDVLGAREIGPVSRGELVEITNEGYKIHTLFSQAELDNIPESMCVFEFVYFARPDSVLLGRSVEEARVAAGRELAIEAPTNADIVIGSPQSGISAAEGFSDQSGIPKKLGLVKNPKSASRSFMQTNQEMRSIIARRKVNANRAVVNGKSVTDTDDSIVRGTTKQTNVAQLREAGATEVHTRIASPPYKHPCHFGMDTKEPEELIAHGRSVDEIREYIDSDSLAFLSLSGLLKSVGNHAAGKVCTHCMTGIDPTETPVQIEFRQKYLEATLGNLSLDK